MALSTEEVTRLAGLARITVSAEELATIAPQLDIILDAVASVSEVAGEDVAPMSHALPLTNVFRDDQVRPGLTREQALAMAPAVEDDRFRVPRILGEEA